MKEWQREMQKQPSFLSDTAKKFQTKINSIIPEKVHQFISNTIKQITKGVISGAGYITKAKNPKKNLELTESVVQERIKFYRSSAAVEGAVTGYGGFLSGLADLPLWLSIKMKMLFEIASLYGRKTAFLSRLTLTKLRFRQPKGQIPLQCGIWVKTFVQ